MYTMVIKGHPGILFNEVKLEFPVEALKDVSRVLEAAHYVSELRPDRPLYGIIEELLAEAVLTDAVTMIETYREGTGISSHD